jgi:phospholipase C
MMDRIGTSRTLRWFATLAPALAVILAASIGPGLSARAGVASPIMHVVIIDQENHSFDNVLGRLCLQLGRCEGPRTAADGTPIGFGLTPPPGPQITITIPLPTASDIVPPTPHSVQAQAVAINGGSMNGFDLMADSGQDCSKAGGYTCYQAYAPAQIPNLASLATNFVIADHTFQSDLAASWGSHLGLVAGSLDGFVGDNPSAGTATVLGPGWGCDSNRDSAWTSPSGQVSNEPACIPDPLSAVPNGGAYRPTHVQWVPTIMDRLDRATPKLTWKLYAGTDKQTNSTGYQASGYQWATCPSFADCLYTNQRNNVVGASQVIDDAKAGKLPAVSIVTPNAAKSQHNFQSMKLGDNWIGQVVGGIEAGPDWASTAIFITYDDCGCFYDHLAPPSPQLGVRVPMVIVSPYAKRNVTDTNVASYASLLRFIERNWNLAPLSTADGNAYDFSNSFNYAAPTLSTVPMVTSSISADELTWLRTHPQDPASDPT